MAWVACVTTLATLLTLTLLPPFVGEAVQAALYRIFEPVCHQIAGRSFIIHGDPLAVCHRCLGIYAGILTAALMFFALHRFGDMLWANSRWFVLGASAVVALDWGLDALGLWANTPLSRVATGWIFGLMAGYYLTRGVTASQ